MTLKAKKRARSIGPRAQVIDAITRKHNVRPSNRILMRKQYVELIGGVQDTAIISLGKHYEIVPKCSAYDRARKLALTNRVGIKIYGDDFKLKSSLPFLKVKLAKLDII